MISATEGLKVVLIKVSYIPSLEVFHAIKFGLHTLGKLNTITKLRFDVRMRFVGPVFLFYYLDPYSLVNIAVGIYDQFYRCLLL